MIIILTRTLIIYATLSLVLRGMGKRQVGELELSDLVATLLLSEVAALPITDGSMPLFHALVPILTVLALEIILTYLKTKLNPLKKLLEGRPSILICRGKINQNELERMRISIEELLSECRLQGYPDLRDVDYAILEQEGQLSVIPRPEKQPLCPEDMGIKPPHHGLSHPVIVDGQVQETGLQTVGRNRAWLEKECSRQGCTPEGVFLMTVDDSGEVLLVRKEKKK